MPWHQAYASPIAILVTGLLGFTGVCLTLWWNSRLSRQVEVRNFAREKRALVTALDAELDVAERICMENKGKLLKKMNPEQKYFFVSDAQLKNIYTASIDKLGMLESACIHCLIVFYGTWYEFSENITLLPGVNYSDDRRRVIITSNAASDVAGRYEMMLQSISDARQALQSEELNK